MNLTPVQKPTQSQQRNESRFVRLAMEVARKNPKLAEHYFQVAKDLRNEIKVGNNAKA